MTRLSLEIPHLADWRRSAHGIPRMTDIGP